MEEVMGLALEACKHCYPYSTWNNRISNDYCTFCSGVLIDKSRVVRTLRLLIRKNNLNKFNLSLSVSFRTPVEIQRLIRASILDSFRGVQIEPLGPQVKLNLRTQALTLEMPTRYYFLEFYKFSLATQRAVELVFFKALKRWVSPSNLNVVFHMRFTNKEKILTKEPLFLKIRLDSLSLKNLKKAIKRINKTGMIKLVSFKESDKKEYIAYQEAKKRTLWVVSSEEDFVYSKRIDKGTVLVDSLDLKGHFLKEGQEKSVISRSFRGHDNNFCSNNPLWHSRGVYLDQEIK